MMSPILTIAAATFALHASAAQPPKLAVNGVSASDNSAIARVSQDTEITIAAKGQPDAQCALLVSLATNFNASGFFLTEAQLPGSSIPIHAIFDGIGAPILEAGLGLAVGAIESSVPSPAWEFGPNGELEFSARLPVEASFVNSLDPGEPLVVALESPSAGPQTKLWLQLVERDVSGGAVRVSNGITIVFAPRLFPANISLAVATSDSGPSQALSVGTRNSLGSITDTDLAVVPEPGPMTFAPDFSLAISTLDIWRIELAGIQPLLPAAEPIGNFPDNPGAAQTYWPHYSGIEAWADSGPVRNGDNAQFPHIQLSGGRKLFHWRDQSTPQAPRCGFGLFFETTGEFRNLTPSALGTFNATGQGLPSPWEYVVAVSPDCNRALVVLDPWPNHLNRLFMLALDADGVFANGLPAIEVPLPTNVRRVFEESISFLTADDGSPVTLFATSTIASDSPTMYPNALYAMSMASDPPISPVQLLPSSTVALTRIDRQPAISADRRVCCVIGGTLVAEDVYALRAATALQWNVTNCTLFGTNTVLDEWSNATDGFRGTPAFSSDGSRIAFAAKVGNAEVPMVARTNGTDAGQVAPLFTDVSVGGLFKLTAMSHCRGLQFCRDGNTLLCFQGRFQCCAQASQFDLFAVDVATGTTKNLTRTIGGGSLLGPWAPNSDLQSMPKIDPKGMFVSSSGDWYFFFRRDEAPTLGGFGKLNLISVSIGVSAPFGIPSLEIVNVTGDEFEAYPGVGPPAVAAKDVFAYGYNNEVPRSTRLRRFPDEHPLARHFLYTGYRQTVSGDFRPDLILFDGDAPGPATFLSDIVPIIGNGTFANLALERAGSRIAFTLGSPYPFPHPVGDRIFVADVTTADAGAIEVPVPNGARIATGSIHFTPTTPPALLFVAGTNVNPLEVVDLVQDQIDHAINPIDANLYFHRFAVGSTIPAQTIPLLDPPPPNQYRGLYPWGVR